MNRYEVGLKNPETGDLYEPPILVDADAIHEADNYLVFSLHFPKYEIDDEGTMTETGVVKFVDVGYVVPGCWAYVKLAAENLPAFKSSEGTGEWVEGLRLPDGFYSAVDATVTEPS